MKYINAIMKCPPRNSPLLDRIRTEKYDRIAPTKAAPPI
jgi:hypothetical protein